MARAPCRGECRKRNTRRSRRARPRRVSKGARERRRPRKEDARRGMRPPAAQVGCTPLHVVADAPWEAIIAAAKKQKCDMIVMASPGRRGVSALLLGSEAER